jgi:hypothetical protein
MPRLLIALVASLLIASPVVAAPAWPHCAVGLPTILSSLYAPAGVYDGIGGPPVTVQQSTVFLAGSAFNWVTGQMPHDITVEFVSWTDAPGGPDWVTAPGTVARMQSYTLLKRPDVSAHAAATMKWKHISAFTGFALYFIDPPPFDTRFLRITYRDPYCPTTTQYVPVTVVP